MVCVIIQQRFKKVIVMKLGKINLNITDKKLLYIIIAAAALFVACVITIFIVIFGGEEEKPQPPSPPKELAFRILDASREFAIIGDDEQVITASDVEGVYIMHIKGENRYLEIRFNEDGAEKFEDAIDDYESLTITLDGKVLVEDVVANEYDSQKAKIDGDYATLMGYFNEMT